MKQIKILVSIVFVLTGMIIYTSCQNVETEPIESYENTQSLTGVENFKTALQHLSQNSITRSNGEEPSEDEIKELATLSRVFLEENNITDEDLESVRDDEMVTLVALSLLDYDNVVNPATRTTAGGCVLEALGVKEVVESLGKGATKKVVKVVVKKVVKKAIPYVGWVCFAWDYISCVTE